MAESALRVGSMDGVSTSFSKHPCQDEWDLLPISTQVQMGYDDPIKRSDMTDILFNLFASDEGMDIRRRLEEGLPLESDIVWNYPDEDSHNHPYNNDYGYRDE
jgi:hypothetical protein